MSVERPLFAALPALRARVPMAALGDFPTPVEPLPLLEAALGVPAGTVYVKRDDLTSPFYGGNKVRTLEVFFGAAKQVGKTRVFATGSFGSNHAVATVVHAPRAELESGAVLYPQPPSAVALENLKAIVAGASRFVALPHWSSLPLGVAFTVLDERRHGRSAFMMQPGGATPLGAFGYVNAALELGQQIARNELPPPARLVLAGGSGCTTAGLLAGFALAARLGIGFREPRGAARPPEIVCVRVTPWPVTSHARLVRFAARTSALVATLAGDESLCASPRALSASLRVDGRFLGRGYGHPTSEGGDAMRAFEQAYGPRLDEIYTAKSAAALVRALKDGVHGPTLYWATGSGATPPRATLPLDAPPFVARWVAAAERRAQP